MLHISIKADRKEKSRVNFPQRVGSTALGTGNFTLSYNGATRAIHLGELRILVSVKIHSSVFVLQVKGSFSVKNVTCFRCLTITFNNPIVSRVAISVIPKCRHFLSSANRRVKCRVRMQISLSVPK